MLTRLPSCCGFYLYTTLQPSDFYALGAYALVLGVGMTFTVRAAYRAWRTK